MKILKSLIQRPDVDCLVCATDAGREGELIFRHIYYYLKCQKPVKRLWINSLTDQDIKNGFNHLENGDSQKYINLYKCAFAREKADWLVGMNLTRHFSNLYCSYNDKPLSIGRVQTPTLRLIVDRENEIKGFKKNLFYKLQLSYENIIAENEEKYETAEEAEKHKNNLDGTSSIITEKNIEKKAKKAPLLFDITSLQKECSKKFSLSAKQTLDIAQKLYENKLITYPRTDSKFLNRTMRGDVEHLILEICSKRNYSTEIKVDRIIDDSKVTDHHAIIPTTKIFSNYSIGEKESNVLDTIILRTVTSVMDDKLFEHIVCTINAGDHKFKASGNRTILPGWTVLETDEDGTSSVSELEKNIGLFKYNEGDILLSVAVSVVSRETKPKSRFTDDTLLSAMENAGTKEFKNIESIERTGLGTGATRAAIIETLISRGYIERKKRQLLPTLRGMEIIKAVPENITDVQMTVDWEQKISDIKNGKLDDNVFIKEIEEYVCSVVSKKETDPEIKIQNNETGNICPECGAKLIIKEGKYGKFEACSNFPDCKYTNNIKKKKIIYSKEVCPECGSQLVQRKGIYGKFLGCSKYPGCKYVKKIN